MLNATAAEGHLFDKWVINNVDYTTSSVNVTMDSNVTATAHFKSNTIVPATKIFAEITSPSNLAVYKWNTQFYINVEVKDQKSALVSGASVTVEVWSPGPTSTLVKRYTGVTDALGIFSAAHKVAN
ncbi:MAG: hypothetical protein GT601_14795 [Acidaminobacter sp.]|nr:hypothetical protein [Acidaminobacter sp.]